MVIEKDLMVSLEYVLREASSQGEVVEEVSAENPLQFMYGTGQMLPHFESNIEGLEKGSGFEFGLTPENAYGEKREELVVDIPMSAFEVEGNVDENLVKIGNQIPMADSQGRRLMGTVLSLSDNTVSMDFNHPMAGTALHFTGKILDVREATVEEKNMYSGESCSSCGSHSSCSGNC